MAETINGLYKTEVIRRRGPWRHINDVDYATLEWVDWFNHQQLLEPIGNVPPAELEQAYYRQMEESAMAAWLKQTGLRRTRGGSKEYMAQDYADLSIEQVLDKTVEKDQGR